MKKKITRRKFIKKGSAGLAGTAMLSTSALSYGRILGSNDTMQMAVIGIRGRGGSHISNFSKMKNVRLKYLVDIDENLFKRRLDGLEKSVGYRPQTEWDMRKVFDDKEIDAVSVATPNHWHALSTIGEPRQVSMSMLKNHHHIMFLREGKWWRLPENIM